MMAAMATDTPPTGRDDPLYPRARQSVLFRRDPGIAALQRALRIGYQHARQLRAAMRALPDRWLDQSPSPLGLEIGAGNAIATVRHFTRRLQQRGSQLIRINPHEVNIPSTTLISCNRAGAGGQAGVGRDSGAPLGMWPFITPKQPDTMTPELDALLCQRHPQLLQHRHTDRQACSIKLIAIDACWTRAGG